MVSAHFFIPMMNSDSDNNALGNGTNYTQDTAEMQRLRT